MCRFPLDASSDNNRKHSGLTLTCLKGCLKFPAGHGSGALPSGAFRTPCRSLPLSSSAGFLPDEVWLYISVSLELLYQHCSLPPLAIPCSWAGGPAKPEWCILLWCSLLSCSAAGSPPELRPVITVCTFCFPISLLADNRFHHRSCTQMRLAPVWIALV